MPTVIIRSLGALKMREWKMQDWKIREKEMYMERHVWHNLVFFVIVCTVISINTWCTYEHRVIPAHLRHGQCRN